MYWALSVAYLFTFITGRHIPEIRVVQTTFNSIVLINCTSILLASQVGNVLTTAFSSVCRWGCRLEDASPLCVIFFTEGHIDTIFPFRTTLLFVHFFQYVRLYVSHFLSLVVSVMVTIILRIVASASHQETGSLFTVTQASSNALSLATNLAATSLIFIWVRCVDKRISYTHVP